MPEIRLDGCAPRPLISYLKALGVLRIVSEQADAEARGRWAGERFELSSHLDHDGLADFVLTDYAPTAVVSPWNGGSGFFPNDRRDAVEAIEQSTDPRLAAFKRAVQVSRSALRELDLFQKPSGEAQKLGLVRRLRRTLPDGALDWLDAAIVLTGDDVAYPPLLGSGGNDGRFDFANNFAQAVVRVTIAGPGKRGQASSASLLAASLGGDEVALEPMSAAHFHRDASPVNSPQGESDGLGNPWDLVLAVEGALLLVAGAARRQGSAVDARLAAPFTVVATGAGYGSALSGERGRAELWLPLWSGGASLPELACVIREARAQVGRRTARSGLDFVRAAGELAVARGISAFERFAILERAGQSSLAVPAGRIEVRRRPEARAIRELDPWLQQAQRYARGAPRTPAASAVRRLEAALFAFADHPEPALGCTVLERLGEAEGAIAKSARSALHAGVSPLRRASAEPWLQAADDGTPEFAVAAAIASLHDAGRPRLPGVRDYLHGTTVGPDGRRTYDPDGRAAIPRLASAAARLSSLHARRHVDARKGERRTPELPLAGEKGAVEPRLSFERGLPCQRLAARLHARGELDTDRMLGLVEGLSLLDYRRRIEWRPGFRGSAAERPAPAFDLLALAWCGTRERRLAARTGWATRLDRGATANVLGEALLRLRLAGSPPIPELRDLLASPLDGQVLSAALLPSLSMSDRESIAQRMTVVETPDTQNREESHAGVT